ncbi:putative ribonuclease H-like domain-containing protein [Tanacetum coccineum]
MKTLTLKVLCLFVAKPHPDESRLWAIGGASEVTNNAGTPTSIASEEKDEEVESLLKKFGFVPSTGVITDFNSLPTEIEVSPTPTLRIHSIHPKSQILGDPKSAVQTKSKVQNKLGAHALLSHIHKQQRNNHKDQQHCLFACFLSQEEPKKIAEALQDDSWVQAMQELLQFKLQQVWVLVDLPHGMRVIGTKWVYRNKRDERGMVVRNKARLVAQGYTQEECIDYDEVFAPVTRIEAIRDNYEAEILSRNLDLVNVKACNHTNGGVTPKTSHLNAVKRIFKYLKGKPHLGLWYPRESPFDLEAFSDSDYGGSRPLT